MLNTLKFALELDQAIINHKSIEPFNEDFSLAQSYLTQDEFLKIRGTRSVSNKVGYKVALTSLGAQNALKTDHPAYGQLLALDVEANGTNIQLSQHFAPLLETELIFKIIEDISETADLDEIAEKSLIAAGIECPESRFLKWFGGSFPALSLRHVIADNCLAGFIVVGDTWTKASELDLSILTCELFVNSNLVASGSGAEVLGNPLKAVEWLNKELWAKGEGLKAGNLISSGTFTGPIVASPGKVIAKFGGGVGEVGLTFG
jgi:2-keto-4-pentenoate hydratase